MKIKVVAIPAIALAAGLGLAACGPVKTTARHHPLPMQPHRARGHSEACGSYSATWATAAPATVAPTATPTVAAPAQLRQWVCPTRP